MARIKSIHLYTAAVILLFALTSCGKFDRIDNGGFTDVEFAGSRQHDFAISSTLTSGILIYAYSSTYATNLKIADESVPASIKLPNGTYNFYAFGYGYSLQNYGTDIRCAVSSSYTLNGTKQAIVLDFRQSTCSNGAFSPSASFLDSNGSFSLANSGPIFPQIDLVHCSTAAGTNLSTVSGSQDCSTSGSASLSAPWGSVSRYQMVIPLFFRNGGSVSKTAEAFRSDCSGSSGTLSPNGFATPSNFRFPVGATALPGAFPFEIDTFADSACTSTPLVKHSFYKGLIFGPSIGSTDLAKVVAQTGSTNRVRIFLREP